MYSRSMLAFGTGLGAAGALRDGPGAETLKFKRRNDEQTCR